MPEGFHPVNSGTSEFVLEHGFLDKIVPRLQAGMTRMDLKVFLAKTFVMFRS
ncbi:MAG: hypothetical protein WAT74_18360 [Flavobacteriales bacterium]